MPRHVMRWRNFGFSANENFYTIWMFATALPNAGMRNCCNSFFHDYYFLQRSVHSWAILMIAP